MDKAEQDKLEKMTKEYNDHFTKEIDRMYNHALRSGSVVRPDDVSNEFHHLLVRYTTYEVWSKHKMAVMHTTWEVLTEKFKTMADRIESGLEKLEKLRQWVEKEDARN